MYSSNLGIQTILSCGKYCQTMQTWTVSRLWLRGRSWRFKIHFWRNIVHFWKFYICSNKLDVKVKTAVSHSSTESEIISLDAGLRLDVLLALESLRSDCLLLEAWLRLQTERGDLLMFKVKILNREDQCDGKYWFRFKMSCSRVKKFYCMCLKTTKQWSKLSLKKEVPQWDMFPEPKELQLIGCLIGLIWIPRSKSNTSTPNTNSLTFDQRKFHALKVESFVVLV